MISQDLSLLLLLPQTVSSSKTRAVFTSSLYGLSSPTPRAPREAFHKVDPSEVLQLLMQLSLH